MLLDHGFSVIHYEGLQDQPQIYLVTDTVYATRVHFKRRYIHKIWTSYFCVLPVLPSKVFGPRDELPLAVIVHEEAELIANQIFHLSNKEQSFEWGVKRWGEREKNPTFFVKNFSFLFENTSSNHPWKPWTLQVNRLLC